MTHTVTSRDVARLAGVSQATVSRVLHGNANIAPETRARVLAVVRETGYQPNAAATSMRTRRTATIGVVVGRITNPFYPQVLDALGTELEPHGLRMILWDATSGPGERAAIEAIDQGRIDGLVFTTATASSPALQHAIDRRAPIVLVNRVVEGQPCDQVDSANGDMARRIARYFADHGHRRVGLISASAEASTAAARSVGFADEARDLGLDLDERHIRDGAFSHEGGRAALERILDAGIDPPTAVFAVNDLSGLGALDAARAAGVAVPEDLWVVGFDDIEMASWEAFQLTTARQPISEMVRVSVELLLVRIEAPTRPAVHHRLPGDLVVRRSTAHAPFRG
jgi:LacI family transcriptional regulator